MSRHGADRAERATGVDPTSKAPIARGPVGAGAEGEAEASRIDVFTGVLLTNTVLFSVLVATAGAAGSATGRGPTEITTVGQAAGALRPVAGSGATMLFALGFIGLGMLAVPVLAAAGLMACAAIAMLAVVPTGGAGVGS